MVNNITCIIVIFPNEIGMDNSHPTCRQLLSSFFITFSEIVSEITFYTTRCSPHVNTGWNRRQTGAYPARGAREDGTLYRSHNIFYVKTITQGFILLKVKLFFLDLFHTLLVQKSNLVSLLSYHMFFNTSLLLCSCFALPEVKTPIFIFLCSSCKHLYSFMFKVQF